MSTTTTLTFGNAIDAYIREQQTFGRLNGPHSERRYRYVLQWHHVDVGRRGPITTNREHVKMTLERSTGKSQYSAHSILISFYDWLVQAGLRKDNPARMLPRTKVKHGSTVYRLTPQEVKAMMAACKDTRERRIVYIGCLTGSRVTEMAALQRRHIERPGWVWFSSDIAKQQQERWCPVLPELEPIVAEILESVPRDDFVIATQNQRQDRERGRPLKPVSRYTISRIVKEVAARAGIAANIYPHLLRHAYGDHVAKHAGLRVAQELMGHSSIVTTQVYYTSRPNLEELAASVRGFSYQEKRAREPARPRRAHPRIQIRRGGDA
jgi:site-specific recombinase XerD